MQTKTATRVVVHQPTALQRLRPSPQTRYRLENAFLALTTIGSIAGFAYTTGLRRGLR